MENEQECLICYLPMSSETVLTIENCKHYFCMDCMIEMIFTKPICPLDRQPIASMKHITESKQTIIQIDDILPFIGLLKTISTVNSLSGNSKRNILSSINDEMTNQELNETLSSYVERYQSLTYKPVYVNTFTIKNHYNLSENKSHLLEFECFKMKKFRYLCYDVEQKILLFQRYCIIEYQNERIDREQLNNYFQDLSRKINNFNLQYDVNINLIKWLMKHLYISCDISKESISVLRACSTVRTLLDSISLESSIGYLQTTNYINTLEGIIFGESEIDLAEYFNNYGLDNIINSLEHLVDTLQYVALNLELLNLTYLNQEFIMIDICFYEIFSSNPFVGYFHENVLEIMENVKTILDIFFYRPLSFSNRLGNRPRLAVRKRKCFHHLKSINRTCVNIESNSKVLIIQNLVKRLSLSIRNL